MSELGCSNCMSAVILVLSERRVAIANITVSVVAMLVHHGLWCQAGQQQAEALQVDLPQTGI